MERASTEAWSYLQKQVASRRPQVQFVTRDTVATARTGALLYLHRDYMETALCYCMWKGKPTYCPLPLWHYAQLLLLLTPTSHSFPQSSAQSLSGKGYSVSHLAANSSISLLLLFWLWGHAWRVPRCQGKYRPWKMNFEEKAIFYSFWLLQHMALRNQSP